MESAALIIGGLQANARQERIALVGSLIIGALQHQGDRADSILSALIRMPRESGLSHLRNGLFLYEGLVASSLFNLSPLKRALVCSLFSQVFKSFFDTADCKEDSLKESSARTNSQRCRVDQLVDIQVLSFAFALLDGWCSSGFKLVDLPELRRISIRVDLLPATIFKTLWFGFLSRLDRIEKALRSIPAPFLRPLLWSFCWGATFAQGHLRSRVIPREPRGERALLLASTLMTIMGLRLL